MAELKQEQEELYYERSIEQRGSALDKELEDFQEEKDAEIEKWEEYLDDVEQVVTESLATIKAETDTIYNTLGNKAEEYNLTLSNAILTPWRDGANAISGYQETFDTAMSSTTDKLKALKSSWQEVISSMDKATADDIKYKNTQNEKHVAASYKGGSTTTTTTTTKPSVSSTPSAKKISVTGYINAGNALIYSDAFGSGASKQFFASDPIYYVMQEKNGYLKVRHRSQSSGATGWFKKSQVKAYAKGSTGVDKDQWAIIDELGEELQLVPDGNGRLAYIQKGTSIVPHDLSEKLMEWGQLDPSEILNRNRPSVSAPQVSSNEINLNITYGDMVSIGEYRGDNLDDLEKMVAKQFEKHTRDLNNALRKYL